MPMQIIGEITKMNVKTKKNKEKGEDGTVFESVERIGEVTIQFDAEEVNVAEITRLINGRFSTFALSDPKMQLD